MNQHFTFREHSCAPSSFNIYSICSIQSNHIVGMMLRVGWIDDTFFYVFFIIVEVVVLLSENSLLNSFVFHVQYSYVQYSTQKSEQSHDTVELNSTMMIRWNINSSFC